MTYNFWNLCHDFPVSCALTVCFCVYCIMQGLVYVITGTRPTGNSNLVPQLNQNPESREEHNVPGQADKL